MGLIFEVLLPQTDCQRRGLAMQKYGGWTKYTKIPNVGYLTLFSVRGASPMTSQESQAFVNKCLRFTVGIHWPDVCKEDLWAKTKQDDMLCRIRKYMKDMETSRGTRSRTLDNLTILTDVTQKQLEVTWTWIKNNQRYNHICKGSQRVVKLRKCLMLCGGAAGIKTAQGFQTQVFSSP